MNGKQHPTVSIIMPAKNEHVLLPIALDSLKASIAKYSGRVEVLLIDNGSTDDTVDIARSKGAIVYIKPALSISGLRNFAAEVAQGDILAFIDADIAVDADWLNIGVRSLIESHSICLGGYIDIPENSTWVQRAWHLRLEALPDQVEVNWITTMNMFVWKSSFSKIGGFNENLITCEDVDLCVRLKNIGTILFDKTVKVTHYGEAKDLKHFFCKELWRGQSNLKGLFSHGINLHELPSLLVPLYYILAYISTVALLILPDCHMAAMIIIIFSITIPFMRSLIICFRLKRINSILDLACLWFVYYTARGISLILATSGRR